MKVRTAVPIFFAFSLLGCMFVGTTPERTIRLAGSETMLPLVKQWTEAYQVKNPAVGFSVRGGGSASGIRALISGSTEIAAASRSITPDEVRQLVRNHRSIGIAILTARDALSIYVHPNNPVRSLTQDQVKRIFTGEIVSWKDLGGWNLPIAVISREVKSGTYLFFQEHVLYGDPYSVGCTTVTGAQEVVRAVEKDSGAIGYGSFMYAHSVRVVDIDSVAPTRENVLNGAYPLSRYLHFYTREMPAGEVKKFIDWVLSKEGQTISRENGFIPLYPID
jgi:phosphate transport system substrate-binding protein